ncbi:MAG: hypothetical protein HRT81_18015, partial [Henriciella sp.]|nr:hypothetical protein [Henriciella sp.]
MSEQNRRPTMTEDKMGDGAGVDTKWVYSFGGGSSDGSAAMKNLLGGKGANLAEMASL